MQVPRWRNVLLLKNTLLPALSQSTTSITKTHFASIHSTPATAEKWKNKWSYDTGKQQQPSKTHARYSVRQKRADTKRALKDLLFKSGCSKDDSRLWSFEADHSAGSEKKMKKSAQRAKKPHHEKIKRKHRRRHSSEDFDDPEITFEANFGNKWYTWSFGNSSSQSSTSGFEWREDSYSWTNYRFKEWHSTGETKSDHESCSVGSRSDRTILGLPATGPLKIEDVKNAFRMSALKWHPDKHQGSSQGFAEEKFKLCVNAYKSLCDALS
ncbi:hypothetical protein Tsubulata_025432 [Turnera subulata]|uniref:J domain-containing protein n=1 Tax=Turnera subulata TaxID=218843 RepID=A0A9Q0JJ17_9ROSI|nr:hypothetical protein Tsubulata_025432 [Turnera subulata]